ncbi:CopG family ribbon-helix-helix protein [Sabulicella rubraurantiaca]|uniref:CopG family ribbon-helix-helix protein n=1 Tax=Sabulicella rubraurantiaca TaxID=2811429 RepID=UPI001A972B16|nr:ribbon-helix-helix protein, CopG family [Sabulicella rubraurantiaca]
MARDAITVRMDAEKRAALDALAQVTDRDRSYLINEAVDAYLAVHRWQIAHIEEGLRQAEAGEFATDEDINAAYARWR